MNHPILAGSSGSWATNVRRTCWWSPRWRKRIHSYRHTAIAALAPNTKSRTPRKFSSRRRSSGKYAGATWYDLVSLAMSLSLSPVLESWSFSCIRKVSASPASASSAGCRKQEKRLKIPGRSVRSEIRLAVLMAAQNPVGR